MSEQQETGTGPSRIEQEAADATNFDNGNSEGMVSMQELSQAIQTGRPTYVPNTQVVDAVSLAKAQGLFIREQTRFLMQPGQYGTQEYTDALGRYSRAQTDLINAMQNALHQADVI